MIGLPSPQWGEMTLATIVLWAWMRVRDERLTPGKLVGVGTMSTALAYVLYFRLPATAGATNALLVTFLNPVSAILLGTTILGDVLHARHLAGMALIGAGLAAIDGRPWQAMMARWRPDRASAR
ncbi:MAG: DMT family transporter [Burkholderiaceae bacterium]